MVAFTSEYGIFSSLIAAFLKYYFVYFKYLDSLWTQTQALRRNEWIEHQIVRPYLSFDKVLTEALQHPIPPLLPPAHEDHFVYPLPRVVFRMFDYLDVPEVSSNSGLRIRAYFGMLPEIFS